MTLKLNGKTYRIRMRHTTQCEISELINGEFGVMSRGESRLNPLDEFDPFVGEREAMTYAMGQIVKELSKAERNAFWNRLLRRWNMEPSSPKKKKAKTIRKEIAE